MSKSNITIQDIAKAINVSASTVSRALNNHPKISQKTKEKIWEVSKKLGYLPNIPIYMQKQKNNIVFLLIDSLQNSSIHEFISAIQNYLIKSNINPIIKFITNNEYELFSITKLVEDIEVIGVISILNDTPFTETIYRTISESQLPIVAISHSKIPTANILPDIYNGAYLATNHLLKQGAKNLVLIIENNENLLNNDLERGFKAAFKTYDNTSYKILRSSLNKEVLKYEFEQLLLNNHSIHGIITSNNYVASQLQTFLQNKNIKIPEDIMLISFGSETFINLISPGISTIEYSSENMGKTAAKQLVKIINNDPIENKLLIEPTKLIIRTSSMRISQP